MNESERLAEVAVLYHERKRKAEELAAIDRQPLPPRWGTRVSRPRPPPMPTSHQGAKSAQQTCYQVWCSLVQKKALTIERKGLIFMVPRDRIELPTRGFSVPCSTN